MTAIADAIIVARDAAAAALPGVAAALATETAYENALTPAGVVDTQASAASTALFNLFDGLGTSFTATDVSDAAAARSAVDAAVLAQQNVAVALASNPNVIAADLTAANALSSHLQTLQSAIIAIQIFVVDGDPVVAGTHDIAISDALGDPTAGANAVSIEADAKVGPTGTLTVAEAAAHAVTFAAEGPARALATLVLDNGLEISSDGSITIDISGT